MGTDNDVDSGGGIASESSMDEFLILVEASLDKHLDARFKSIEAKLDRLVGLADGLEKAGSEMMKNPMIAGMMGGGDGFEF